MPPEDDTIWSYGSGTRRHARTYHALNWPRHGWIYCLRPDLYLAIRCKYGETIKSLANEPQEMQLFNFLRDAKAWINTWIEEELARLAQRQIEEQRSCDDEIAHGKEPA